MGSEAVINNASHGPHFTSTHCPSMMQPTSSPSAEHFLSRDIHEVDYLLNQLSRSSRQEQSDAIDELLRLVHLEQLGNHSGELLSSVNPSNLFKTLNEVLRDSNWEVKQRVINVVEELIRLSLWSNVDEYMEDILPSLITSLGDIKVAVRRATSKCLRVYVSRTKDFDSFSRSLIKHGLQSSEQGLQRDCCLAFPHLFGGNVSQHDFSELITNFIKKLGSADQVIANAASNCLEAIQSLLGDSKFESSLQAVSPPLRKYYQSVMGPQNDLSYSVDSLIDINRVSHSATASNFIRQSTSLDILCNLPNSSRSPGLGRKVLPNSGSGSAPAESTRTRTEPDEPLICGFIPVHLKQTLDSSKDARDRITAVEQIKVKFDEMNKRTSADILLPSMPEFLSLLECLLSDANFHVVKYSLEMLCSLVERMSPFLVASSRQLVYMLTKSLGDNKIVVQVWVMKYAMTLIRYFEPQVVLEQICELLGHKNSRIRQETLDILIAALLHFPSVDFRLDSLCSIVAPALVDKKNGVRQSALECVAVLAHLLGPGRLGPLVAAVDAVEICCSGDDTAGGESVMEAVQERLTRRQLPHLTAQGMVEYVGGYRPIASASSSTSSASSRRGPVETGGGESALERRRPSAGKTRGRAKLPWDQQKDGLNNTFTAPSTARSQHASQWNGACQTSDVKGSDPLSDADTARRGQRQTRVRESGQNKVEVFDTAKLFESTTPGDGGGLGAPYGKKLMPLTDNHGHEPTDEDWSSSPIPLKPALARSAGRRRGSIGGGGPSPVPNGRGNSNSAGERAAERDPVEGGYNTARTAPASDVIDYRKHVIGQQVSRDSGNDGNTSEFSAPSDWMPVRENSEMSKSLASIRSSASRKKALKVFEDAAKKTDDGKSSNGKSKVDKKYNPYTGATFKDNPHYDALVIGRGYADDSAFAEKTARLEAAPPADAVTTGDLLVSSWLCEGSSSKEATSGSPRYVPSVLGGTESPLKQGDHRKPIRGTVNLSPLSLQTGGHFRAITDWTASGDGAGEPTTDEFNIVGKRVFDHSTKTEDNTSSVSRGQGHRNNSRNNDPRDVLPSRIVGMGVERTQTEDDSNARERIGRPRRNSTPAPVDVKDMWSEEGSLCNGKDSPHSHTTRKPPALPHRGSPAPKRTSRAVARSTSNFGPPHAKDNDATGMGANQTSEPPAPIAQGPVQRPEKALLEALDNLANNDWQAKVEGLSLMTRLADHHADLLLTKVPELHQITLAIVQECANLRSQVSRLAIQTMNRLYISVKRGMDADLNLTVRVLLQKAGESSGFIREDVETALTSMVQNVTPQRAMLALIQGGASHKNSAVRKMCATYLCMICEDMGPGRVLSGVKDTTDRILPVIAQFTLDGNPETRYFARKLFYGIMNHEDFERMCSKYIAGNTWRGLKDIIENLRTKGLGEMPSATPSASLRRSSSLPRGSSAGSLSGGEFSATVPTPPSGAPPQNRPARRQARQSESAIEEVHDLTGKLAANDWRDRLKGIQLLGEMVELRPELVANNIVKIFDKFVPRLSDSNSKVNLCALQALRPLLPRLATRLGPMLNILVQHTAHNLASNSQEIVGAASSLLDAFTEYLDASQLVQPYVQSVTNGNPRVKPEMIGKLMAVCEQLSSRKPRLIIIHVLPEVWRLLASTASSSAGGHSLREATQRLVTTLYIHLGNDMVEAAKSNPTTTPRMLQLLNEMIQDI